MNFFSKVDYCVSLLRTNVSLKIKQLGIFLKNENRRVKKNSMGERIISIHWSIWLILNADQSAENFERDNA